MKKRILAVAAASSALFCLPVQAAPVTSGAPMQSLVQSGVEQVHHCRYWSGGWACGWGDGGGGYEGHSRYYSHRRHGSESYEGGANSGYEGHSRYYSHRRHGSEGYGGGGDGEHSRYWSHRRSGSENSEYHGPFFYYDSWRWKRNF
ncbi:MAG: hypothetical protein ACLPPF_07855 [Rhodomicrobium sp.]